MWTTAQFQSCPLHSQRFLTGQHGGTQTIIIRLAGLEPAMSVCSKRSLRNFVAPKHAVIETSSRLSHVAWPFVLRTSCLTSLTQNFLLLRFITLFIKLCHMTPILASLIQWTPSYYNSITPNFKNRSVIIPFRRQNSACRSLYVFLVCPAYEYLPRRFTYAFKSRIRISRTFESFSCSSFTMCWPRNPLPPE
jgi:hypothetical protein